MRECGVAHCTFRVHVPARKMVALQRIRIITIANRFLHLSNESAIIFSYPVASRVKLLFDAAMEKIFSRTALTFFSYWSRLSYAASFKHSIRMAKVSLSWVSFFPISCSFERRNSFACALEHHEPEVVHPTLHTSEVVLGL